MDEQFNRLPDETFQEYIKRLLSMQSSFSGTFANPAQDAIDAKNKVVTPVQPSVVQQAGLLTGGGGSSSRDMNEPSAYSLMTPSEKAAYWADAPEWEKSINRMAYENPQLTQALVGAIPVIGPLASMALRYQDPSYAVNSYLDTYGMTTSGIEPGMFGSGRSGWDSYLGSVSNQYGVSPQSEQAVMLAAQDSWFHQDPETGKVAYNPANTYGSSGGGGLSASQAAQAAATGMATNAAGQTFSNAATIAAQDAANFGSDSDGGSSGGGGGGKIVCTAMNEAYGFGSFRNRVWIKYARDHLTKAHEVGYHTIFLPLVDYGYRKGNGWSNKVVRQVLEHIARHRGADLRAEMRHSKRDNVGRAYRFVLEPLCYIVGKLKGY